MLTTEGYSVIVAGSSEEGVALARSNRPDLVILDVAMPDLQGGEVAEKIHEIPEISKTPIIFLTALLSKSEEQKYKRKVGGGIMFAKPYKSEELLTAISELLNRQWCNIS